MSNFMYNPKSISEMDKDKAVIDLLSSATLKAGDLVSLKGASLVMTVTSITIKTEAILYGKIERITLHAEVVFYSKGRAEFTRTSFPIDCLVKVDFEY